MSNHYIGLDLFDLENNGLRQPISRITLYRGDNAALTAGDDTGLEVVADCIYVTQEMVEALLSAARGYQYHAYSAQAARLNPAAELGDTVEVGNIVSVLAQIFDNGDLYPDIAAPGDREVEDEYPAAGPLTKAFDKKLAQARSLISKTNDRISLEIYGEDGKGGLNGRMNTFTMGLSGISGQIKGYQETLEGYSQQLADYEFDLDGFSSNLKQYSDDLTVYKERTASYEFAVDGFKSQVKTYQEQAGKTQKAYSTIDQRVNSIKMEVTNGDNSASIQLMVDGKAQGSPAEIKMTGLVTFASLKAGGTSEIDGSRITTGKISADHLALTGKITWNDLSSTCQSKIGDGLTENDVYTYIDKSLVASPTIAGGVFQDEAKKPDAELYLDKEYDDDDEIMHAGLVLKRNIYSYKSNGDKNKLTDTLSTLQIWDSGQDLVSFLSRGNLFLRTYGGTQTYGDGAWYFGDTVYFTGNVDFSNANVIWE